MEDKKKTPEEIAAEATAAAEKAAEETAALEAKEKEKEGDKGGKTITMTEEDMNAFADRMYKKGATNSADAKVKAELEAELAELREFKVKSGRKEGQSPDEVANQEKLDALTSEYDAKIAALDEKLTTEQTAREGDMTAFEEEKLRSAVLAAAAKAGAHDPEDVFLLMRNKKYFEQDGESKAWQILNPETGRIRIDVDAKGEPLALAKGVAEYVEAHSHMKRGSNRTGSGQGNGTGADRPGTEVPEPKGLDTTNLTASQVFENRKALLDHVRAGGKGSAGGRGNQPTTG